MTQGDPSQIPVLQENVGETTESIPKIYSFSARKEARQNKSATPQDFDSSDDEIERRIAEKLREQDNDELLYDSEADDEDEVWIEKNRKGIVSDALLSCPLCFTTVCLECQQHQNYHNQYRAIESINTKIVRTVRLRYGSNADEQEYYFPVRCETCEAEIGVFDEDEVYHFFHVIAEPV